MSRRPRSRRRNRTRGGERPAATAVIEAPERSRQTAPDLTPDRTASYDRDTVTESRPEPHRGDRSFGEILRRERELRRISLREVNEATKINIRYLEALERNEFTYLPAGAFTRGFIRAYARYIGLDEAEMINAYLYELRRQEDSEDTAASAAADEQLRAHFGLEEEETARRRRLLQVLVLAGGAIVVLAVLAALAVFVVSQTRGADAAPTPIESRLL